MIWFAGLAIAVTLVAFKVTDDSFIEHLAGKLVAYNQQLPREKVYLHTDRETYMPGETIWMKGYLVNGALHTTDSTSRVLYVDLIDMNTRKQWMRLNLKADYGYAPGYMALPDSLPAGTYQLRAYTGWMRNFPNEVYTKTLTLFQANEEIKQAAQPNAVDIQFLPEGGNLIAGLAGRVGFKAVDETGKGADIAGFVLDAKKDTIVGFEAMHLGMGYFSLTPEAGQSYTAYVKRKGEAYKAFPLPAVQTDGYVMMVDNLSNKDNIRVLIAHTKPLSAQTNASLIFQSRGLLVQASKLPLTKRSFWVQIPREKFPEGVGQITLFDETNKQVAERLFFVDHKERLNVTVKADKASYKPREEVKLDITVTDNEGKPAKGNFSLAVTDTKLAPEAEAAPQTIASYLLLESDLKGEIEQPGYYFDEKNDTRNIKLDLLMMIQGWRRFTWPEVLSGDYPTLAYDVETGLTLSGQAVKPGRPVARTRRKPGEGEIAPGLLIPDKAASAKASPNKVKLTVVATSKDSTRSFMMGETDDEGHFALFGLAMTDTTNVFIQATSLKGNNRNYNVTLDAFEPAKVMFTKVPFNPIVVRREEWGDFVRRTNEYLELEEQLRKNNERMLKEVTVKAKKLEPTDTRRMMYGAADASVKFDQMNTAGAMTILDVIRSRVAGVMVTGSGTSATVQIRGAANFQGAIEPLFLMDGMPVDKETALTISVQDVEAVDVIKGASTAMYGSRGAGGVIAILLKRGGSGTVNTNYTPMGTLLAKIPGFQPRREFYAPRYDVSKPEHVRPDHRATLHWQPMITVGESGKSSVSFFASDALTRLRIVTEGAAVNGMPGSSREFVEVKR
ncbi:TonB-dependent receptor plug domain-containing protein [Arsenicibacter rosenii]|uniref:TonB-dependent receptor plug domain-containing protein n=1 Tax=Arsenicibacter rosenii TaxID=1750698 RepID=UPI001E45F890|nr:TonB-dependent receptor plug domain-containing protein [Arsenicibacter rosenii]